MVLQVFIAIFAGLIVGLGGLAIGRALGPHDGIVFTIIVVAASWAGIFITAFLSPKAAKFSWLYRILPAIGVAYVMCAFIYLAWVRGEGIFYQPGVHFNFMIGALILIVISPRLLVKLTNKLSRRGKGQ